MTFTITIDGPAGVGKGTLARSLADYYDLALLETGLLYRCLGRRALQNQISLEDEEQLEQIALQLTLKDLMSSQLRHPSVSQAASKVAVFHKVRQALLNFQKTFASYPPQGFKGTILDGRDTGTVICPQALVKFFINAKIEIRAERRFKELQAQGIESIYTSILQDMIERDSRDCERAEAPLKAAADAYVLDTSFMTPAEVLDKAIAYVETRRCFERELFACNP